MKMGRNLLGKLLLIFLGGIALVNTALSGNFIIKNISNPSQYYFVINGTTGDTSVFGNLYLKNLPSITPLSLLGIDITGLIGNISLGLGLEFNNTVLQINTSEIPTISWVQTNYYDKSTIDSWNLIKHYTLQQDLNANNYRIIGINSLDFVSKSRIFTGPANSVSAYVDSDLLPVPDENVYKTYGRSPNLGSRSQPWENLFVKNSTWIEQTTYPYSNPSALYVSTNIGDAISVFANASDRSGIYVTSQNPDTWTGYFEGGKGVHVEKYLEILGNSYLRFAGEGFYIDYMDSNWGNVTLCSPAGCNIEVNYNLDTYLSSPASILLNFSECKSGSAGEIIESYAKINKTFNIQNATSLSFKLKISNYTILDAYNYSVKENIIVRIYDDSDLIDEKTFNIYEVLSSNWYPVTFSLPVPYDIENLTIEITFDIVVERCESTNTIITSSLPTLCIEFIPKFNAEVYIDDLQLTYKSEAVHIETTNSTGVLIAATNGEGLRIESTDDTHYVASFHGPKGIYSSKVYTKEVNTDKIFTSSIDVSEANIKKLVGDTLLVTPSTITFKHPTSLSYENSSIILNRVSSSAETVTYDDDLDQQGTWTYTSSGTCTPDISFSNSLLYITHSCTISSSDLTTSLASKSETTYIYNITSITNATKLIMYYSIDVINSCYDYSYDLYLILDDDNGSSYTYEVASGSTPVSWSYYVLSFPDPINITKITLKLYSGAFEIAEPCSSTTTAKVDYIKVYSTSGRTYIYLVGIGQAIQLPEISILPECNLNLKGALVHYNNTLCFCRYNPSTSIYEWIDVLGGSSCS